MSDKKLTGAQKWVRGVIPSVDRDSEDFYPTPPAGTRALLSVEKFQGSIREPACGDGSMAKVLEEHGYQVISTDLYDRGYGEPGVNWLTETHARARNVVTNPPFKKAQEFVEQTLKLALDGKVAMLMRLMWLEGGRRQAFFKATPLARIWVFSRRLNIARDGWQPDKGNREIGGMIAFAWYVWDRSHEGAPQLGWIDPILTNGVAR